MSDMPEIERLRAELAAAMAREAKLRDTLNGIASWREGDEVTSGFDEPHSALAARDALALPTNDSALREMIEAARREEREACIGDGRIIPLPLHNSLINEAAAAEREACAVICESRPTGSAFNNGAQCAAAIRARSAQ